MAVLGVGVDVVQIERLRRSVENVGERFLERVFTPEEVAYCQKRRDPYPSFAARFAAKEALIKALPGKTEGISFQDMQVIIGVEGKPVFNTRGRVLERMEDAGVLKAHVSLSHERDVAVAVVVLEGEEE